MLEFANKDIKKVIINFLHSGFFPQLFGLSHLNEMMKGTSSFGKHTLFCAVALRSTTFGSWPVADAAIPPSGRESITGVPRLKGEIPLGPVGWMRHLKIVCHRFRHGFHEGTMSKPKRAAVQYPVPLQDFNDESHSKCSGLFNKWIKEWMNEQMYCTSSES